MISRNEGEGPCWVHHYPEQGGFEEEGGEKAEELFIWLCELMMGLSLPKEANTFPRAGILCLLIIC